MCFLLKLLDMSLYGEKMPEEWRESVLVLMSKNKVDGQRCNNHRGIKLMSRTMKIWERVMEEGLREELMSSDELSHEQQ